MWPSFPEIPQGMVTDGGTVRKINSALEVLVGVLPEVLEVAVVPTVTSVTSPMISMIEAVIIR